MDKLKKIAEKNNIQCSNCINFKYKETISPVGDVGICTKGGLYIDRNEIRLEVATHFCGQFKPKDYKKIKCEPPKI